MADVVLSRRLASTAAASAAKLSGSGSASVTAAARTRGVRCFASDSAPPARIDQHSATMTRASQMNGFGLMPGSFASMSAIPAPEILDGALPGTTRSDAPAVPVIEAGAGSAVAAPASTLATRLGVTEALGMSSSVPVPAGDFAVTSKAMPADLVAPTSVGGIEPELPVLKHHGTVELATRYIPRSFRDDLRLLFIGAPEEVVNNLKVVTVTVKTDQDMAQWSSTIADEKHERQHDVHHHAARMCSALKAYGYWADYVDPATGKPVYGPHTSMCFRDVDDRNAMLGFSVKDFGCCKAISHAEWGTHIVMGSVFTDAPLDVLRSVQKAFR